MSGGVTRTATEAEALAAHAREADARAEREEQRALIGGVSLVTAEPGLYVDCDGDEWTRHADGGGATAHCADDDVHHPEDHLPDTDELFGPFRRQVRA